MSNPALRIARPSGALAWLAAALVSSPAGAAGQAAAPAAEARYQRDLAACAAAGYVGDRQACRREAGAARGNRELAAIKADPAPYARNALKRCEPLPEADRADCMARMQGLGTTTGTPAAGGIYRELATRQVDAPAAAASAASK